MVITYIHSNHLADQIRVQVRCRNMVDAINRTGTHRAYLLDLASFVQNTPLAQRLCLESDLLIIHRYLYGPILSAIQYWKARDKTVIADFDQAVNYLTEDMPAFPFWHEGLPWEDSGFDGHSTIEPTPFEQFKWGLALVDAATVSSVRLVDDWSHVTNIFRIPDFVNSHHYPLLNQNHGNEIWIGMGNCTGYESFKKSGLAEALENVCRKRPQVRLVLPGSDESIGLLNIGASQLNVFFPHCFEDWVGILLELDIGLAPIHGNYSLRLDSYDLLEFMIAKIPWIASETPALQKLSQLGQWTQNTPSAWEHAILNTVDQLSVKQRNAAGAPFLYALSQDIGANVTKVLQVYSIIMQGAR
ncbi:MAG TPA: hypothetical protein PKE35_17935 [Anaerolineales bacterium]|nr:hypothetical protein [Anaerolineales bacterium]HNC90352.1 hypothetical protein [Anaerolineales bacterium]